MKLKRIIAIACTAAMTVSLISGCGGASDKGQKEAVKEAEGTAKEDLPLAKYPETVTVHLGGKMNPNAKIPKGMSFEDNSYTRLLKENLNIEVVYDWTASTSDYDEKMSLCIGSNTIPEIMNVNATQYRALLKYDMIQPLDDYFDDYASDALKSYVKSGGDELTDCITNDEGKIMAIPAPNLTAGGVNEMWIRQDWLDALGLDTTLVDTATFSRDSADTISKTVSGIKESAEQNGWDADSSVLNYLSNTAQLQLNIPESDWPGGLTITVSNDLRTSVVCNSSAEVKIFATLAEERVIAADLQEKYGSLFTSLLGGEYTDVTDGGDSTIYGQPCSLFVKFAVDSFHYLLVSVDTDGNLLSLHETDRTVEPLGEYTSVSRAEADKRLANGEFLTDSYTAEAVDPAAEPEHLANLRLTYVQSNAAYYLPMWEYTIDEGSAALGDGDHVDQTLHSFAAYYVPAVELDEIDALKNK